MQSSQKSQTANTKASYQSDTTISCSHVRPQNRNTSWSKSLSSGETRRSWKKYKPQRPHMYLNSTFLIGHFELVSSCEMKDHVGEWRYADILDFNPVFPESLTVFNVSNLKFAWTKFWCWPWSALISSQVKYPTDHVIWFKTTTLWGIGHLVRGFKLLWEHGGSDRWTSYELQAWCNARCVMKWLFACWRSQVWRVFLHLKKNKERHWGLCTRLKFVC